MTDFPDRSQDGKVYRLAEKQPTAADLEIFAAGRYESISRRVVYEH